jgi:ubiquinone/menaquinone biosynthesis C-methylase UbiE
MSAHYDDKSFSYPDYWQGRDYEHHSEVLAIHKLLGDLHFASAADIGGGYGRLIPILSDYSQKLTLVEPSAKQLKIASDLLSAYRTRLNLQQGTADKSHLPDASQDLVMMIRVMHHLPEPLTSLVELNRILKPGGLLILEFANSHHIKAKIQSFLSGQPLLLTPIERRSLGNIKRRTIPFVNHAPPTIKKLLTKAGFEIQKTLSVSNFRIPWLKKALPPKILLGLENMTQIPFSTHYYGPSIFILARKFDNHINP